MYFIFLVKMNLMKIDQDLQRYLLIHKPKKKRAPSIFYQCTLVNANCDMQIN